MNTSKGQGICALAVPPLTPPLQSENNTFLPPGALREAYPHTHLCLHLLGHVFLVHLPTCMLLSGACPHEAATAELQEFPDQDEPLCTFKRLRLSVFFFSRDETSAIQIKLKGVQPLRKPPQQRVGGSCTSLLALGTWLASTGKRVMSA